MNKEVLRNTPYDPELSIGARNAVRTCLRIQPEEKVTLIADNACAHRFILGAATTRSWRNLDLAAVPVTGNVTGKSTHEGSSANALGDPRIAWVDSCAAPDHPHAHARQQFDGQGVPQPAPRFSRSLPSASRASVAVCAASSSTTRKNPASAVIYFQKIGPL